ncbi:cytochrome P450 [Nakamurella endophytica]
MTPGRAGNRPWTDRPAAVALAHEVRRTTPSVPTLAAKVRRDMKWHGHRPGHRILLDVTGTGTDARHWTDPQRFRPDRFATDPRRRCPTTSSRRAAGIRTTGTAAPARGSP